jgi:PAS domain S-box-containing protein
MEQKETQVGGLFQEFQSLFDQSTTEDKKLLVDQLSRWTEQQKNILNLLPINLVAGDEATGTNTNQKSPTEGILPNYTRNLSFNDLQNRVEKEVQLSQIAENIDQVIWIRDTLTNRILYVSPSFTTVWGRSCESLYTDSSILIESVHPEDRVQVVVSRSHSDHKPLNQTFRILRPDNNLRWIFTHTFSIQNHGGKFSLQCCIAQDITDQKMLEQVLRKTLNLSREQFDLSRKMSLARKPEAVLKTLMSANELRSAQRAALLFFEDVNMGPTHGVEMTALWRSNQDLDPWLSEGNLYEEPTFWSLFQPGRTIVFSGKQSDPRLADVVRNSLSEGKIQTMVIFPLVASGNWLGCLVVYYQQEHSYNHIELRHLKILVDQASITLYNLKLLEIAEESRHEAERANEIKTEFLAMISHELRTPLTSIIGFTTTLLADDVTWEPDEQRDFIQTIEQEANRLQELIDHLLDLSRLEAGMLPISPQPHFLDEIIQDAQSQFRSLTKGKTLTMHFPANLPQINVDSKRIAQVLVNLVRNAATYSPDGSEINISACTRGNFAQISVADEGPGIFPSEHKKVFRAFIRGVNIEKDTQHGAGLGLAICKGLIEAHGGRIWIKKRTGIGTTICFTVPLVNLNGTAYPAGEGN